MDKWILDQSNLDKFLTNLALNPMLERDSGLTYINFSANGHDMPLFFVIRNEGNVLQLISYFPYQLPSNQVASTARLLHLLNRDLDVPGFGMDEEQSLIFYRLVLPCFNKQVDSMLLRTYIDTIKIVCDSFSHAIGLISSGNMDLDVLKQQIKEEYKNS